MRDRVDQSRDRGRALRRRKGTVVFVFVVVVVVVVVVPVHDRRRRNVVARVVIENEVLILGRRDPIPCGRIRSHQIKDDLAEGFAREKGCDADRERVAAELFLVRDEDRERDDEEQEDGGAELEKVAALDRAKSRQD